MELFDAIKKDAATEKNLDPSPLPLEDLKTLVQAGLDAPSGKNGQTTGFIIIQDPEVVEKIKTMPGANGSMATAPAYIACHISRKPDAIYDVYDFEVEDCAAAVQNILLAATALHYATVWIDGWLRIDQRAKVIGQLCGLPEDRVIRVLIPVGKPLDQQKRPVKKSFEERTIIV